MALANLLALLDDIATVLDDISTLTKVAAKKTVGVLGDDLALNAEQVAGVTAERELPVVLAVARGSLLNKLILVPAALLISALIPWLITPMLMMGGAFLCFEGFEKVFERYLPHGEKAASDKDELLTAFNDSRVDMAAWEKDKIRGAIRTDFVLSAEIIVIALGAVRDAQIGVQAAVVSLIALVITIGVYGIVAGIVKMDDGGLYLLRSATESRLGRMKKALGNALLQLAPRLMKVLTIAGTAAMFLVGGGILAHGFPWLHHGMESLAAPFPPSGSMAGLLNMLTTALANMGVGVIAGGIVVAVVLAVKKIFRKTATQN